MDRRDRPNAVIVASVEFTRLPRSGPGVSYTNNNRRYRFLRTKQNVVDGFRAVPSQRTCSVLRGRGAARSFDFVSGVAAPTDGYRPGSCTNVFGNGRRPGENIPPRDIRRSSRPCVVCARHVHTRPRKRARVIRLLFAITTNVVATTGSVHVCTNTYARLRAPCE